MVVGLQVKWMMYWIVFALFTCVETFTDLFVAWSVTHYFDVTSSPPYITL